MQSRNYAASLGEMLEPDIVKVIVDVAVVTVVEPCVSVSAGIAAKAKTKAGTKTKSVVTFVKAGKLRADALEFVSASAAIPKVVRNAPDGVKRPYIKVAHVLECRQDAVEALVMRIASAGKSVQKPIVITVATHIFPPKFHR